MPLAFNSSLADPPRLLVGALVLDSFAGAGGGEAIALGRLVLALFDGLVSLGLASDGSDDSAASSRAGACCGSSWTAS